MDIRSLCILVCAGSSSRMGDLKDVKSKVLLPLDGSWTVLHEVLTRLQASNIDDVVIVCSSELHEDFTAVIKSLNLSNIKLVPGGNTRSESVNNGLKSIGSFYPNINHDVVLVHDGARPFFSVELLKQAVVGAYEHFQGYVFAVPVVNTIKVCNDDNTIAETLDRKTLWEIQTPQVFPRQILIEAYKKGDLSDSTSDDSTLVEKLPHKVSVLKSVYSNIKITTSFDINRAKTYFLEKST